MVHEAAAAAAGARRNRRQINRAGTKSNAAQNKSGKPNSKSTPRKIETDEKMALTPSTKEFRSGRREPARLTSSGAR